MPITFEKLQPAHFPLLLKWLTAAHVRAWWDSDVEWSLERVAEKYKPYTQGYKRLELPGGVIEKPMHAYVILQDAKEIGYIQYYNKYDFPSEYGYALSDLPANLAAIDFYIGEPSYLRRGIGADGLKLFIGDYVFKSFDSAFVDPHPANIAAIRTYEKAGFLKVKATDSIVWMLMNKTA